MVVAPHSPLTALTGPLFRRDLTLDEFCGRVPETPAPPPPVEEGEEGDGPPFNTAES
jgi:hypothetical protein